MRSVCPGRALTDTAVPGVVAAAALEVPQAAVPGEGVHDPGRADGVHKGGFPGSWGREGKNTVTCKCRHQSQIISNEILSPAKVQGENTHALCSKGKVLQK